MKIYLRDIKKDESGLPTLVEVKELKVNMITMSKPDDIYKFMKEEFRYYEWVEEYMHMLALNACNNILSVFEIAHGAIDAAIVRPDAVYKRALLCSASSIVVTHNHPSLGIKPSIDDNLTTKRLYEAGKLLGIQLMDHLILGDGYFSYHSYGFDNL